MYLVLALLAPIVMFGLIPGLAWFEEKMLGPGAADGAKARDGDGIRTAGAQTVVPGAAPATTPVPDPPVAPAPRTGIPAPEPMGTVTPLPAPSGAPTIPLRPISLPAPPAAPAAHRREPRHAGRPAPTHHHIRHTIKRRRGLHAA